MHLTPSQRCTEQMSGNCGDLVEEDCQFYFDPIWTGKVIDKYFWKRTFFASRLILQMSVLPYSLTSGVGYMTHIISSTTKTWRVAASSQTEPVRAPPCLDPGDFISFQKFIDYSLLQMSFVFVCCGNPLYFWNGAFLAEGSTDTKVHRVYHHQLNK